MRTLEPALALIKYEKDEKSVKELTPVPMEDCEPRCELNDPDEWTIYNHIRANKKKYPKAEAFVQLVLMLEPGGGAPDAGAYQVSVLSVAGAADMKMSPYHAPDGIWYFVPPKANDSVKCAGRQEILIKYAGEPNESRTVQVYILPSSTDDENYRLMLEEVAQLHQKLLVTRQTAGTVSVGQRWESVARGLERDVERMGRILYQLENAPDQDLVAVQSRVPSYKVKKLTAKAIVDQEAGRRLVRTSLHTESLDIYEHRMIRAYLEKLRRQVLRYREMERQERADLAGEEISQQELKAAHKCLDKKLRQLSEPIPNPPGGCREFRLQVEGIPVIRSDGSNGCFVSCFPPGNTRRAVLFPRGDGTEGWFNGMALVSGRSVWQHWFLRHCMRKLAQFWENPGHLPSEEVVFRMSYTRTAIEESRSGYKRYKILISHLESMTLPGSPPIQFREFADSLQSIKEEEGLIRCIREGKLPDSREDDSLFYDASLVNLVACRAGLLSGCSDWDGITQQIDRLLGSPVLRGRSRKGEQLHASNLFAHHRLYRQAYALMQERREQLSAIDLWMGKSAPVGATHHVYEIWCLLRMLSIWIHDYSFTLVSHTIKQLTDELRRRTECGAVGPIKLVRKTGALKGMALVMEYNQTFKFMEEGEQKELRPDYCLTICYGGKAYRFFMDAKYHNFSEEQMGIETWYKNLYGVALNKYISRLGDTCLGDTGVKVKTSGSYILHPDTEERRPKSGWDTREFFWYKSDIAQSKADPESAKVLSKLHGLLEDEAGGGGSKAESLSFGSICFTPRTEAPFRSLMQMVMEHFLGTDFPDLYLKKCWICGSEDVDCKLKHTVGGNEKYYITCKSCKQFWVRTICAGAGCGRLLGKHRNNYYRIKPGTSWNVICPNCATGLE